MNVVIFFVDWLHSRRSIRLKDFDYSKDGLYFVTIDVQDKLKLFWEMGGNGNQMGGNGIPPVQKLNDIGLMIQKVILDIPKFYIGIMIDSYVVMPDHVHVIIKIDSDDKQISLPEVIARFKIFSTNQYINGVKNNNWPRFPKRLWQRNYYERIIRNERELENTREYIKNNPIK